MVQTSPMHTGLHIYNKSPCYYVHIKDLSCVMDIITSSLDHGQPGDVIYLDLQKAFDSVPQTDYYVKLRVMVLVENF